MNTLRVEISHISNVNHQGTMPTHMEKVQSLQQEVVQLKEASRSTSQPNPGNFASISMTRTRISMIEKFDGTRSKF